MPSKRKAKDSDHSSKRRKLEENSEEEGWQCKKCTYSNKDSDTKCEMCSARRPRTSRKKSNNIEEATSQTTTTKTKKRSKKKTSAFDDSPKQTYSTKKKKKSKKAKIDEDEGAQCYKETSDGEPCPNLAVERGLCKEHAQGENGGSNESDDKENEEREITKQNSVSDINSSMEKSINDEINRLRSNYKKMNLKTVNQFTIRCLLKSDKKYLLSFGARLQQYPEILNTIVANICITLQSKPVSEQLKNVGVLHKLVKGLQRCLEIG
eukprot:UN27381